MKLNRYEVSEKGSRAGEIGTIGNRTFRLEGRPENNGIRDNNGFYPWALNLSNSRFAAQGITPTAAQSAAAFIDCYATMQPISDGLSNLRALLRDDNNRRVLLDAVNNEVNRLRGGKVSEDGVKSGFDAKEEGRSGEDGHVQKQDHIADFQEMAALAYQ